MSQDLKTNMIWILRGVDSLIKHNFDVKMDEINYEQLLKSEPNLNKKCFPKLLNPTSSYHVSRTHEVHLDSNVISVLK